MLGFPESPWICISPPLRGGDPKHTHLAFDKGSEEKTQVLALARQELY